MSKTDGMEPKERQDPFLDPNFAPLDTRNEEEPFAKALSDIANEIEPTPEPPVVESEKPPVVAITTEEEPSVIELDGGGTITIEEVPKKGWKATLQGEGGGTPEVFYGHTKAEMYQRIAAGKLNATKQIRKLNRQIKFGTSQEIQSTPVSTMRPQIRDLTADEKFEVKTALQADPDLALESWFQKKTGMSVQDLVALAGEGRQAKAAIEAEAVARGFMDSTPDYYGHHDNFVSIVRWLWKHKLNKVLGKNEDPDEAVGPLYEKGLWTVENLTEAYEDLTEAGLLVSAPEESEEVIEVVEPPVPTELAKPATTTLSDDDRIDRQVRRPRAGLGLRTSETVTAAAPEVDKSPSAEGLENLSDSDVEKLLTGVRNLKLQTRR